MASVKRPMLSAQPGGLVSISLVFSHVGRPKSTSEGEVLSQPRLRLKQSSCTIVIAFVVISSIFNHFYSVFAFLWEQIVGSARHGEARYFPWSCRQFFKSLSWVGCFNWWHLNNFYPDLARFGANLDREYAASAVSCLENAADICIFVVTNQITDGKKRRCRGCCNWRCIPIRLPNVSAGRVM